MNRKYSLNPKEFDIGGTEKYYSDMAAKGWKLTHRGPFFSKFERAVPEAVRYRIEVVSPKLLVDGKLPEEQVAVYADCGWEYVTGNEFHHVFRAPAASDAPEFYLEPAQQAETIKALRKRYIANALSPLFYILLFTLLSFLFWNVTDGHWFAAFYKSWITDTYCTIGYILLLLGLVCNDIWGTVYLSRLYRKMKKGVPLNHESTSKHRFLKWSQSVILALGVICLCSSFFGKQVSPLPKETTEPYVLLHELGISGERTANYVRSEQESEVRHQKSLLAESWDTREFIENQQWLYQEVYVLRNPQNMDLFVESLMYGSTFAQSPEHFTQIDIPGLDQAWITEHLECIAVKNNTVAILTHPWESQDDIADALQRISQKWAQAAA